MLAGNSRSSAGGRVRVVILDPLNIYSEYAPYSYMEDVKEFIDQVSQLNRVV